MSAGPICSVHEPIALPEPRNAAGIRLGGAPHSVSTEPPANFELLGDRSVRADTTKNRLIEGDNLPVMAALKPAYLGRIKLAYIDPPYNTGNQFTYADNRGDAWVASPRLSA